METEIGILVTRWCRGGIDGAVVVGIRPEDVKLGRSSNEEENRIEGKVLSSTFLGDQLIAEVKIKEKILVAKALADDEDPVGSISVHLPKGRLVVFPEALGNNRSELEILTEVEFLNRERRTNHGDGNES